MADEIRPIDPEEIPTLGRFLTGAFGTDREAPFAAPDVLGWKLLDPMGGPADLPRGLVAVRAGRILGYLGIHPCPILRAGGGRDASETFAIHPIDWVVSAEGTGLGARLLMRVHRMAGVHLAIGLTPSSAAMGARTHYVIRQRIPVLRRVLRPWYRLRDRTRPPLRRVVGAAGDVAGMIRPARSPVAPVELEPASAFGPEPAEVVARLGMEVLFTRRDPELLNHLLRFPRPWFAGFLVRRGGRVRGWLIVGVVPRAGIRVGKVVDCFLDEPEPDLWLAAIRAGTAVLRDTGADVAECFGTTPWLLEALRAAGYREAFSIPLYVRDRSGTLPADLPFHLTHLEADYAYT